MAHKITDRCKETTSTTGTGTLTLIGAVTGFVGVTNATTGLAANGDTGWFCAENAAEWEVFLGTRVDATHLARTTVIASSNGGSLVSFTAAPTVFGVVPASKILPVLDKAAMYLAGAVDTTSAGWQKIPIDTVMFDTASITDTTNKRITPKRPGYYQVNARVKTATSATLVIAVGLNGSISALVGADAVLYAAGGSAMIYCNGTTDYLELWCYAATVRAITNTSVDTYMQVYGPL